MGALKSKIVSAILAEQDHNQNRNWQDEWANDCDWSNWDDTSDSSPWDDNWQDTCDWEDWVDSR